MRKTRPVSRLVSSFPEALAAVALMAAAACVTVNVNFPEATVQKATDDYVRELYRAKEKGRGAPTSPESSPKGSDKQSSLSDLLIAPAHADAEANFKVNSDKALAIRDRLATRLDKILAAKRAGTLAETNDGLLTVDHDPKLSPMLKKSVQPLAEQENADRLELYREVLSSNGLSKNRLKDIQKNFGRSFQAESPSKTWVQDADGKWARKP